VVRARLRGRRHDLETKQHDLHQGIYLSVLPTFRMMMQISSCKLSQLHGIHSEIIREPVNCRLYHVSGCL